MMEPGVEAVEVDSDRRLGVKSVTVRRQIERRIWMAYRKFTAIALFLIGSTAMLVAQEQQRVAVGGFKSSGERARLVAVRIEGLLEAELLRQTGIKVVERKESDQVFNEQRLQQTGITDVATAVELGKNLNVDRIVFGAVEEAAGVIHMTLKAVKVENSELVFSESAEAEIGNQAAVSKAYYSLMEGLLTALSGREIRLERPSGPQRLVLTLAEGDVNPAIKIPKKSVVMAVLIVDNQTVDSTVVAKRTGWTEWNARLTVPSYESQEIVINFYVKGREGRQYIGGCGFETPADGVYSFGMGDKTGNTVNSRFRVSFEVE